MNPRNVEFSQFNEKVVEYADFVGGDPIRNFLQYPAIIAEMGDVAGKRILDVGCGDGQFARSLAKNYKAEVVGYDKGESLIRTAQTTAQAENLNVKFEVSDAESFKPEGQFDFAVSNMVLPYAQDEERLKGFFRSTCGSLADGGKFISVVLNPVLKDFGRVIPGRILNKAEDGKVEVSFLDPKTGKVKIGAKLNQFTAGVYEQAATVGGFRKVNWKPVYPTEKGKVSLGDGFWQRVSSEQPYSLLVAEK